MLLLSCAVIALFFFFLWLRAVSWHNMKLMVYIPVEKFRSENVFCLIKNSTRANAAAFCNISFFGCSLCDVQLSYF